MKTVRILFYYNGRFNFLDVAETLESAKQAASLPNAALNYIEHNLKWEPAETWDGFTHDLFRARAEDGGEYYIAQRIVRE